MRLLLLALDAAKSFVKHFVEFSRSPPGLDGSDSCLCTLSSLFFGPKPPKTGLNLICCCGGLDSHFDSIGGGCFTAAVGGLFAGVGMGRILDFASIIAVCALIVKFFSLWTTTVVDDDELVVLVL